MNSSKAQEFKHLGRICYSRAIISGVDIVTAKGTFTGLCVKCG